DRSRCQRKGWNKCLMHRSFVVIGESVAIMAYRSYSFFEIDKPVGTAFRCHPFFGAHGVARQTSTKDRMERVLREDVFDVRDEQFLVLLFMMHPEDENRLDFMEQLFVGIREQSVHARIDGCAVALSLANGWPRDQSPQISLVHVARSVVVGVKEIRVFRNFRV